jgi:hypothetical protein
MDLGLGLGRNDTRKPLAKLLHAGMKFSAFEHEF